MYFDEAAAAGGYAYYPPGPAPVIVMAPPPQVHAAHQPQPQAQAKAAIKLGTTVMVTNLAKEITAEDVREIFARAGEVKSVAIHYDSAGKSKGTADVVFRHRSEAEQSITEFDGRQVDDNVIRVRIVGDNVAAAASSVPQAPVVPPAPQEILFHAPTAGGVPQMHGSFAGARPPQRGRGSGGGGGGAPRFQVTLPVDLDVPSGGGARFLDRGDDGGGPRSGGRGGGRGGSRGGRGASGSSRGGGGRGGGRGGARAAAAPVSSTDLDAEMSAYMSK